MHDVDHDHLYATAESQSGYFTAGQALEVGMDRSTLSHHARPGGRYGCSRLLGALHRWPGLHTFAGAIADQLAQSRANLVVDCRRGLHGGLDGDDK